MGSKSFDGVRFSAYTDDHLPPHIHGSYAGVRVIVNLMIDERMIRLSARHDRVLPRNAKRSTIKHVLDAARNNFDELVTLWENAR